METLLMLYIMVFFRQTKIESSEILSNFQQVPITKKGCSVQRSRKDTNFSLGNPCDHFRSEDKSLQTTE